ncbi:MFS transporter [Bombilactobacillus thymidiniphilus]|uniref:MFS transporter n=1 Tax=Bombilactobacillus thymidiniphilus TaxID=2923363 RepID=A0ABY4PC48_9LACO|nr:MFS transporter [Bombilactobacillus thymidiniphilus]UQS83116.1 MFS transporter [Bombilactobacillus thymidiniphilus]
MLINAGSFVLSGFILFHLKYVNDDNVATANKSHWNFKNMLTVFADFSWLKFYLYIMVVLYFSLGCIGSILQYYFIHNLHLKGIYLGLTFVLFEFVPVLLASLLINYLIAKFSYKFSIVLGVGVFAISIITMGLSTNYLIVVLSGMVQNFFGTIALISWESIRQERIPSNTLGTVSGVVVTVQSVLTPIGGIIASILLSKIHVQNIFIYSGLFCLILTLIIYGVFEFNDATD